MLGFGLGHGELPLLLGDALLWMRHMASTMRVSTVARSAPHSARAW
jgi:hypothetical protein